MARPMPFAAPVTIARLPRMIFMLPITIRSAADQGDLIELPLSSGHKIYP
jgi:hypothetical protein